MKHVHLFEKKLDKGTSKPPLPKVGFVRLNQIVGPDGSLPISKSGFWAGVKSGKFPQPLKISPRVTVWRVEDIISLIAEIEKTSR